MTVREGIEAAQSTVMQIVGNKDGGGERAEGTGNVHRYEIDEVIKNDYDKHGNLINRSIVPKGYESVEEFKAVVGHVDDYLNASPKNNIINKGLAGGTHVKGVDYDILGFPIFKGDDVKFTHKLDEELFIARDLKQFKECTKALKRKLMQV